MHIPKHIVNISVIAIVVMLGYIVSQNLTSESSQSDNITLNTGSVLPVSQSDTGIETDTGKRLETVGNSGTNWGMSPFGSGKPLEEEKKLEFKKPNTEWKTRTLSGITYVFGEGNPIGADPLSEKEKKDYSACYENTIVNAMDCPIGVTGYITPDVEKSLYIALTHPTWETILTKCASQFQQYEFPSESSLDASYIHIMSGGWMDMEKMLWIDERTGRKTLSSQYAGIYEWLSRSLFERKEFSGRESLSVDNCISRNGGIELYRLMDQTYNKQFFPDGKYPLRLTDQKIYIPFH